VVSSKVAFDGPGVDLDFGKDVLDLLDGVFLQVVQFGKICLHELLLVAQNFIQRGLTHQLWVLERIFGVGAHLLFGLGLVQGG
jgi:hypothetical protein